MHIQNGLTQRIQIDFQLAFTDGFADLVDLVHVDVGCGGQLAAGVGY